MTITERNNLQYDLRHRMWLAQMEVETCKEEIARLNRFYKEQFEPNLFEQMFGDQVMISTPAIYTDTPMAEEVYGG